MWVPLVDVCLQTKCIVWYCISHGAIHYGIKRVNNGETSVKRCGQTRDDQIHSMINSVFLKSNSFGNLARIIMNKMGNRFK